jgi:UDPglucose--hexose-1-phosphate uridylyltransferase
MGKIKFESFYTDSVILDPFKGFNEETHRIEIRKDPLTGNTSTYNPRLRDKVKFFFGECDEQLIEKLKQESAGNCIFCSDGIEKNTPRYPASLVREGRIRVGEAVLLPNLFPVGKYHAVIVLSKAHFLRLSEFSEGLIGNGLKAARLFVKSVYRQDPSDLFVTVNANYLFPAGATLVHPHLQMLISPVAFSYHGRLIDAGGDYYERNGSSYFEDLVSEERETGSRYVAQKGKWHWLTSFSPIGANEIIGIHENGKDFGVLSDDDLQDLSFGISRVLCFYESLGHLSFNYSIMSVRSNHPERGFRCMIKVISRQNLYRNYRNDDYFLQKLLHSELIINPPEELASGLRKFFHAFPTGAT